MNNRKYFILLCAMFFLSLQLGAMERQKKENTPLFVPSPTIKRYQGLSVNPLDITAISAARMHEESFIASRELFIGSNNRIGIALSGHQKFFSNFGALKGLAQVIDSQTGKSIIDRTLLMTSVSGSAWLMQFLYSRAQSMSSVRPFNGVRSFLSIDGLSLLEEDLKRSLSRFQLPEKCLADVLDICNNRRSFADNLALVIVAEHVLHTIRYMDPTSAPLPILAATLTMGRPQSGCCMSCKKPPRDLLTFTAFIAHACLCGKLVDMAQFKDKILAGSTAEYMRKLLRVIRVPANGLLSAHDLFDQAAVFFATKTALQSSITTTTTTMPAPALLQSRGTGFGVDESRDFKMLSDVKIPNYFDDTDDDELTIIGNDSSSPTSCTADLPLILRGCKLIISTSDCFELVNNAKFYQHNNKKKNKNMCVPYPSIKPGATVEREDPIIGGAYAINISYGQEASSGKPLVPTVISLFHRYDVSSTKFRGSSQALSDAMERTVLAFAPELMALSKDPFTKITVQ